jgi:SAM-dependent methyltransferase
MPADLGIPAGAGRDAVGELRAAITTGFAPDEALRQIGVDVRWPVDATGTGLPAAIFDCAISSNVLEHVPPDGLRAMFAECRRLLRAGGTTAHHIDPGDHFTSDGRITSVNFLKFSPLTWRLIGSGLAYHNRLRCPDYPPLLEQAGFEIEGVDVEIDEQALEQLRAGEVRPHATFAEYSDEELAGALIDVFARVGEGPAQGPQDLA